MTIPSFVMNHKPEVARFNFLPPVFPASLPHADFPQLVSHACRHRGRNATARCATCACSRGWSEGAHRCHGRACPGHSRLADVDAPLRRGWPGHGATRRPGHDGACHSAATCLNSPAASISRRSHSGAMSNPFGQVGAPNSRNTRAK